jgi:hypothetical protein
VVVKLVLRVVSVAEILIETPSLLRILFLSLFWNVQVPELAQISSLSEFRVE